MCGYCGGRLRLTLAGFWECPRCAPLLDAIDGPTLDDVLRAYARFCREAAAVKRRTQKPLAPRA